MQTSFSHSCPSLSRCLPPSRCSIGQLRSIAVRSASKPRLIYALGFVGLFTTGGLSGLFLASIPVDVHVTDTYFVAHFHYIRVGGSVSAFFGGLHFWWPKITGKLYPESWARFAAILMYAGFNMTFLPQFFAGYLGMPRRYHTYPAEFQI
jgi:cytochrome c oxidase subunit I